MISLVAVSIMSLLAQSSIINFILKLTMINKMNKNFK